ncbi:flagellar basal body-associated FliL family protein [Cribrihabitans sp. XS_ASV171]
MKKLVPILALLLGLGGGVGAGLVIGPKPADIAAEQEPAGHGSDAVDHAGGGHDTGHDTSHDNAPRGSEYIKLSKQFVVPLVKHDRIAGMVTLGLSLETAPGVAENFFETEPKLRAAFLEVLFDHANMGGFEGAFTRPGNLDTLRTALLEAARRDLGPEIREVLIVDIARQDS